jgi:tetratricopeptide (TPR) repeat protein
MVGWNVAEAAPDAGFAMVELAAAVSTRENDWGAAAAAVQEFVTRAPRHLPALMRLVEICVDGSLEATLYSAQAQLADAYIAAGMADEARFISEDLVAREPWDRANIERFRKTLEMAHEPDPDAIIAERLSGQSPFMSTDLSFPPFEEPVVEAAAAEPDPGPDAPIAAAGSQTEPATALSADSVAPPEMSSPKAFAKSESVEVDLSIVLDDPGHAPSTLSPRAAKAATLDGVFDQLREEALKRSGSDAAENEYNRALVLYQDGNVEGAIAALEAASRAPKLRFVTAAMLGRLYKQRGMAIRALEWMERAAVAPAPTPQDHYELLYELADGLESNGEVDRALTTLLELQSGGAAFRDVNARIDRLARVARG